MSLNWVMLDERKQPVPLPNERILDTIPSTQLVINIPQSPALSATGTAWLTSHRFVFVANAPQSTSPFDLISQTITATPAAPSAKLDSLSLPWTSVLSTSFVQPYFAANYLAMDVRPAQGGGLELGTTVEVRLVERGMYEFVKMVEGVRVKAIEKAREERIGEPLPLYDRPPTQTGPNPLQTTEDLPPGYTI